MQVNTVIEVGRRNPASKIPTQPRRVSAVNLTGATLRQHAKVVEARRHANALNADLRSAVEALACANAENDRLRCRVVDLTAEIDGLKKELAMVKDILEMKTREMSDTSEKADTDHVQAQLVAEPAPEPTAEVAAVAEAHAETAVAAPVPVAGKSKKRNRKHGKALAQPVLPSAEPASTEPVLS